MPHRVSVVGAGIGAQHCAAYAEVPDHFEIHSVCDLDQSRGRALADQYGARVLGSMDDALHDPEIDIIDVCLPSHMHFSACMKALEAGKAVICEKPLASSLHEVDALIEKMQATGGRLFPVFQYRYGVGTAQLKALIEAGLAGRCYAGTLETHWNRDAEYYAVGWRGTWDGEQGGALVTHAIHMHDMLQWLLGPVARVYAERATRVNDIETEDCAAITIKMTSGALITSSVTLGAASEISRMRLMFEGFTVQSDLSPYSPATNPWSFEARAPTEQRDIDAVLSEIGAVQCGYAGLFAAISDALSGRTGAEVKIEDARQSVAFATAVYASDRTQQPVELPLTASHPNYRGWLDMADG